MISEKHVKEYCCEDLYLIENYEKAIKDKSQTWQCHHRLETELNLTVQELIDSNRYWKVEAKYLIFLTEKEHVKLHKEGKPRLEETRLKISKSHLGIRHSEESRKKMSEMRKGRKLSEEHKLKIKESMKKLFHTRRKAKTSNALF